ncbi:MAG: undecaprenyl-diphosphate phosphatase [Bacteroidetes bacterium]|nr:undecaprenyl-diphosphate phosphatase [Bacteroidota bacterium]
MNIVDTIILGIVQGLTEFLPVSSSGHLVISKTLLNVDSPGIFMEISLHLGTMLAICAVFWKDIYLIFKDLKSSFSKLISRRNVGDILKEDRHTRLFLMVLVATVPTAIIALLFEEQFERFFSAPALAGAMLIVTGTILWFTKNIKTNELEEKPISFLRAIIIGAVQGMAITPGISRSGTTIAAATFMGVNRSSAAKFSFLLSIPAILGAVVTKLDEMSMSRSDLSNIIIGTVIATVVGYIALRFLVSLIEKGKFYVFSYYCWAVGIGTVIVYYLK